VCYYVKIINTSTALVAVRLFQAHDYCSEQLIDALYFASVSPHWSWS